MRPVISSTLPLTLPFSTNLPTLQAMPFWALARASWFTSQTLTSRPALAQTWAMPEPMRPEPTTKTRLISMTTP